MKEIIFGIIAGSFSGAGMGGGIILIFLLTFISGIEHHIAQAINLIFFIPTSIVAIIINATNKNIDFKLAIVISIFGILGAVIGVSLSIHSDVNSIRKFFGLFLLIISMHEIYIIIKENKIVKIRNNK